MVGEGGYMEDVKELKERVGYIEREKIVKIEEDITQIRLGQVETNTLVKEFSRAIDTQCRTMESMTSSMQEMSLNMRDNNNSIKELKDKFTAFEESTTEEMDNMKNKIEVQSKRAWDFIKDNVWKILGVISVISVIAYIVLGKVIF